MQRRSQWGVGWLAGVGPPLTGNEPPRVRPLGISGSIDFTRNQHVEKFSSSHAEQKILPNTTKTKIALSLGQAEDSLQILLNWLERFPHYKAKDFYITSESCPGKRATNTKVEWFVNSAAQQQGKQRSEIFRRLKTNRNSGAVSVLILPFLKTNRNSGTCVVSVYRNVVHGSDSPENGQLKIGNDCLIFCNLKLIQVRGEWLSETMSIMMSIMPSLNRATGKSNT
ncbi:serine carboxypeptidase II-2-like protein [Tanacetum coccineum]